MTDQEMRETAAKVAKLLAYETDFVKVSFLQGRLQMALEIMEARGIKWIC
jgi:hypothetical protein